MWKVFSIGLSVVGYCSGARDGSKQVDVDIKDLF